MADTACLICGHHVKAPAEAGLVDVKCPRCGHYRAQFMDLTAESRRVQPGDAAFVSAAVRTLSEVGQVVEWRPGIIEELRQSVRLPSTPTERFVVLLDLVLRRAGNLHSQAKLYPQTDFPILNVEDGSGLLFYLQAAQENGWLRPPATTNQGYSLTLNGWNWLEESKKQLPDTSKAFVAMWFDASLDEAWKDGFRPALKDAGYDPVRVDLQEHNGKICDRIIAEIRKSGLLVADFTGQRGGVYFEAGFAQGLGIPVIWTCRKDHVDKLHFDTRQYSHVVWEDAGELREKLFRRIEATVPLKRA